ncbi:cytochrome P450 [Hypoxylon fuscum]|nr:cytochrome P450 [Hypoxylon fuscum]
MVMLNLLVSYVASAIAFYDKSTRAFEPTIRNQINIFLIQLLKSNASPVNMTPSCRHLGLDILTSDAYRYLTDGITFGNYRVNTCLQFPPLARVKLGLIMDLFPGSLRAKLMGAIQKMITSRLAQPSDARHDLLSVFTEQSDVDMENLRQGQLWAEAIFFFAAGGETIASTLAATSFYLSQNQQCYQKLATEIRSAFGTGADIRGGQRLSGCRYLRACIDESLRMSPPHGYVTPPGAQIGVSIYSLHHNKIYFLSWSSETSLATHDALVPFSIGPRGCAGKAMAYLETSLVIAMTFWYFDFEMASDKVTKQSEERTTWLMYDPGEFPIYDLFAAGLLPA